MAREMKDSGIEWIGEIPREWSVYPAKFAFSEIRNKNTDGEITKALKFYNGTIIPKSNFDANSDDYVAETITTYTVVKTDMIMINGLNLNYDLKSLRVGLVKEEGVITSAYLALMPDVNRILPLYATYLFKGYETRMAFHNMGAGIRKTLGFKEFKNQPVLIPSLSEQQAIADFLDTQCVHIDSVIEKTRAAIEEYKRLKQSVITQAVTKGIRPNREMKDSGIEWIGEVPSAFVCRKLKSLALLISKGATPKDISIELDNRHIVRFLKSENIVDNHLKEKPEFRITTDIHEGELKRSVLSENDILFVIAGASIGKTAVMEIGLLPANTNQAVSFIRIESKYCFAKKYIWYFLQSEVVKRFIFLFAVQSAQPNLSMENLGSIRMPFPKSKEEVLEIITYLDEKTAAIDSLIQKKEQLITELEAYKKSLIYEYVTGKKEVPVHAH